MAALHRDPLTGLRADPRPFRIDGDGVVLTVRVTPGARKPGIESAVSGADGRCYGRVRVRAKAQDGAANADVIETLATALGRPRSALALQGGMTLRIKTIRITGSVVATMAKLEEMFAP